MGMFDYLRCQYPLPDPDMQAREFQTKSLRCEFDQVVISADGRLLWAGEGEVEYRMTGGKSFSGLLNFYDWDSDKVWRQYVATFEDGRLIELDKIIETDDLAKAEAAYKIAKGKVRHE